MVTGMPGVADRSVYRIPAQVGQAMKMQSVRRLEDFFLAEIGDTRRPKSGNLL